MRVSDIWDDAKSSRGYGSCDANTLYARISEAIKILSDESEWDFMVGHMDICAFDGCLTLPREIEKPLAVSINGFPAWGRDRWFMHHINGPGDYTQIDNFNSFYDEVGPVCTFREIPQAYMLMAVPEDATDNGKVMTVYGYDIADKELYHTNADGEIEKGIRIPITTDSTPSATDAAQIKVITRVFKPETAGSVNLWAYNPCDLSEEPTLIGFYYPDETEPRYRRMRFPKNSCVSMKYRRKTMDVKTQADWIPFDSKTALMSMLKGLQGFYNGDNGRFAENRALAIDLLAKEQNSQRFRTTVGPQVKNFTHNTNERLRGGWGRYGGAWGGCNTC